MHNETTRKGTGYEQDINYRSITDTVITETSGGNRMAQQKLGQTRSDNVIKKEMIAMLLAGGQGSRLGVLTANVAKPAVSFGGKYRIIDFPLSNCINSGIDTVGVLTQYQPLRLNSHIGIGITEEWQYCLLMRRAATASGTQVQPMQSTRI